MLGFLERLFRRREFRRWTIDESVQGYRIHDLVVRREDIAIIAAFKHDLITIDRLCLGIGHGEPDERGGYATEYVEEDNPSYRAVLRDLEQHFALKDGWWDEVTRPAFEPNRTVIWSRQWERGRLAKAQESSHPEARG